MPYIGRSTDGFGVRNRFIYLASSGDTSVSGADANGATLTFTDGAYVDVYLNGVLLKPTTDYNTSTAGTIAGLSALNTNDEVTVVVYDVFTVADMVSATSGGTFVGNVTMSGDATIGDDLTFSSDGAVLSFGADADVTLTHVADQGLTLKSTATDGAGGLGPILNLSTGDTDIAAANQLGTINFQAPDEGTGTDAVAVVASITAIAQEDFAADANGTSLLLRSSDSGTNDGGYLEIKNDKTIRVKGNIELDRATESSTDVVLYFNGNGVDWTLGTDSSNGGYLTFSNSATVGTNSAMVFGAGGKIGIGNSTPGNTLDVIGNVSGGYAGFIHNDGDSNSHYGLRVAGGRDDGSTSNAIISICDGDNEAQGHITISGSTVSYGAFTAHHEIYLPDADKANGYAYGTLLDIDKIYYTQKNGKDSERGIRYLVKKTQDAYSRKILGTYSSDMLQQADQDILYTEDDKLYDKIPEGKEVGDIKIASTSPWKNNLHQAGVLGDGHVICNGEKGNIIVGDGICSSSTAGVGMKADKMSMIIGIAQEDVTFSSASETKLVPVQYGVKQFIPWTD